MKGMIGSLLAAVVAGAMLPMQGAINARLAKVLHTA